MAKLEWGNKRICLGCSLKYYDFNKSPITCPSCKVEFDPDVYLKSRKGKNIYRSEYYCEIGQGKRSSKRNSY